MGFWTHRLVAAGVRHEALVKRFGESVLDFTDPDGMSLSLVGVPGAETEAAWSNGDIPAEHAIRGFHGVTLMLDEAGPTGVILSDVLGFKKVATDGALIRFKGGSAMGGSAMGGVVDLRPAKGFLPGRVGRGSVHHVAFRAANDGDQAEIARRLREEYHLPVTEQRDRNYFRSIYFREPGGILFEIATDAPGFTVDEPLATLGSNLKLPAFLEPRRKELEAILPSLEAVA